MVVSFCGVVSFTAVNYDGADVSLTLMVKICGRSMDVSTSFDSLNVGGVPGEATVVKSGRFL